ncbi:MAG: RlmE family RNA methyltransferase, partial [Planctomycetes bacterium]|nr:RlmE family RNA methyltransferase [Planctomycetota bacterium]
APGSWLQVAAKLVGPEGVVVGIDLNLVEGNFRQDNIHLIQGDLREITREDLMAPLHEKKGSGVFLSKRKKTPDPFKYQVVLSDMAPDTMGDQTTDHHRSVRLCRALLERLGELLGKGGNCVIKVFEGEAYPELLAQVRGVFNKAKGFKPKASRNESREMYIIAHGFTGTNAIANTDDASDDLPDQSIELPKRKPSKGWGEKRS